MIIDNKSPLKKLLQLNILYRKKKEWGKLLKRKVEQQLLAWKNKREHNPLIVKGCRQCGKTTSVLDFANKNYKHVVYLNFFENSDYISVFKGSIQIDNIIMLLSALLGKEAVFKAGETVIILDEIQICPEARTALKFFEIDGRFDVIGIGSLLDINNDTEQKKSIPVAYETIIEMQSLDFEEFLWASGISDSVIEVLRNCLKEEIPVPDALNNRMKQLLLQYAAVGGMPNVVQTFVNTKRMDEVLRMQREIVHSFEEEMVNFTLKKEKVRIKECFQSIPKQIKKKNKKFQYSVIKKGSTASNYAGSLKWLENAGIISQCHNLSKIELPLDMAVKKDVFKVYMRDCGLFVSMLENGSQFDILQGNIYKHNGAVIENLIADIFTKMGRKLYYFHKDSGLEIDFVICYKGKCTLVDVKAVNGNAKGMKTILLQEAENHHVNDGIRLGNYNIARDGHVLSLPLYIAFLLD